MVATVCSATAWSSACIASTTDGGKMISSLVVPTSFLFGGNRTYRPVHVEGTGNPRTGWEDWRHDGHPPPPPVGGPARARQAARPGGPGRRNGHPTPPPRLLPRHRLPAPAPWLSAPPVGSR